MAMPVSKWDDVGEIGEEYVNWMMDRIEDKSKVQAIDREAMSAAALFVGVTGLVGNDADPDDWDRLGEVAVDLVDEILALVDRRMSSFRLSESEGR